MGHLARYTGFDLALCAALGFGGPGKDRDEIVDQNTEEDRDQGIGDVLHRAGQLMSGTLGVNLPEGAVRAFIVIAAGGTLVNIVRDGAGVRSGNSLLGFSVCVDIDLTVVHVDQKKDRWIIPEVLDGTLFCKVCGCTWRGICTDKCSAHIFRDDGIVSNEPGFLLF